VADQQIEVQAFLNNGGRIMRLRDFTPSGIERTITVALKRVIQDNEKKVLYGVAVHKQHDPRDTFDRKGHNFTAVGRCLRCPVIMPDMGDKGKVSEDVFTIAELIGGGH